MMHAAHIMSAVPGREWSISDGLIACRTDTHASAYTRTVFGTRGSSGSSLQHAHGRVHVACRWHPRTHARHRTNIRRHLIHHVVRKMAVKHPVARIISNELKVPRLSHSHQHRIAWNPCGVRNTAAFRSGDVEGMPV